MNYICEFLLFITAGLAVNRIEEFWARKKEAKNRPAKLRKNCIEKIRHCMNELEFNAKCIGGPTCPFKTEALERLLNSEEITLLEEDLINSLKQIIAEAGIARAPHAEFVAVRVKSGSKLLKDLLQKQIYKLENSKVP